MKTNGKKTIKSAGSRPRSHARARTPLAHKPIWQEVLSIAKEIPEGDLHKLPTDLAANHDHYLYGSRQA